MTGPRYDALAASVRQTTGHKPPALRGAGSVLADRLAQDNPDLDLRDAGVAMMQVASMIDDVVGELAGPHDARTQSSRNWTALLALTGEQLYTLHETRARLATVLDAAQPVPAAALPGVDARLAAVQAELAAVRTERDQLRILLDLAGGSS